MGGGGGGLGVQKSYMGKFPTVFLEDSLTPTPSLATYSLYKRKNNKYRRRYKTVVVVARPPPPLLPPRNVEPITFPPSLPSRQHDTWSPHDEGNSADDEYEGLSITASGIYSSVVTEHCLYS